MNKLVISTLMAILLSLGINSLCSANNASVQYLNSGKVLPANLPFSEAVRVGNMLYLSGQLGVIPGSLTLASGGIEGETRQAMKNIETILKINHLTLNHLVKCTVMMADIKKWGQFNEVYKTFFTTHYPARSAFGTSGLGLGAELEIECFAAYPQK